MTRRAMGNGNNTVTTSSVVATTIANDTSADEDNED
jgi:hypothetical protein